MNECYSLDRFREADPDQVVLPTGEDEKAGAEVANRRLQPIASLPHLAVFSDEAHHLVNKGTKGWDCPGLLSWALARKLKSSNNFVLQAASRCLRQVPGNNHRARIYLSMDNRAILDRQLKNIAAPYKPIRPDTPAILCTGFSHAMSEKRPKPWASASF